jgi:hypothetical protein
LSIPSKTLDILEYSDKYFLGDVLGLLAIAEDSKHQIENLVLMGAHQLRESLFVSSLQAADQFSFPARHENRRHLQIQQASRAHQS